MKNILIILISLTLFLISCQTNAKSVETNVNENKSKMPKTQSKIASNPTPEIQRQNIHLKIGIIDGNSRDICLRTKNGDLAKDTPVSIVTSLYESPQKVLKAIVEKKLEKGCSRYASESTDRNPGENFYYSLTLTEKITDEYQEVFGIGVIEPKTPVQVQNNLASIDLNNDGKDEFFRRCADYEGVLLTIWTEKPLKGKRLWSSFYYLDYDTEPNCKDKDWEGLDD